MRKIAVAFLLLFLLTVHSGSASEELHINARAAVLIDGDSGRVLFAQNADEMLPEASCTKIMTALVALENSNLTETVVAGKNAYGVPGTSIYLSAGEALTMEQMLYGLMLRSGNDAAVAIAEHVSGSISAFCQLMNARAAELDADAHFVNPHGLDADGHAASALSLARIMRAAMRIPEFRAITGTQKKIIPWVGNEYSRVLENKNRLLHSYEGATGGKTGYTGKAGRCLVFAAKRDDMELIGAVLGCPEWFDSAEMILDYGFANYRKETAFTANDVAALAEVRGARDASVAVLAETELSAAVAIGDNARVVTKTELLTAPISVGQYAGSAQLIVNGKVVAECHLIASCDVPEWGLVASIRALLRRWALH